MWLRLLVSKFLSDLCQYFVLPQTEVLTLCIKIAQGLNACKNWTPHSFPSCPSRFAHSNLSTATAVSTVLFIRLSSTGGSISSLKYLNSLKHKLVRTVTIYTWGHRVAQTQQGSQFACKFFESRAMQSHPCDHTLFLASKESLLLTNWLEGVIPATYMSDGLLVQKSWGKHSVVCHGQVSISYFAEPEPMLLQSCSSFLLFPIKIELVLWLRSEPSSSAFVFGGKCCSAWCALRPKRTAVCKVMRHQVCIACFIIISSSWRLCGFDC